MSNRVLRTSVIYIVLSLWGLTCIYPMLWMFGASLKLPNDVMVGYNLFPKGAWHWETYFKVWDKLRFFKYFINSVNITVWTLAGVIIIYTMTAFALAKLKLPGVNAIFFGFIAMMFVPGITIMVPLYIIEHYLHILNTHLGLILPYINGAAPFSIFLFRNYFQEISHELYESAKIDGAGVYRVLFQIYFPLAVPAIATITIINFLGSWNNLLAPMVLLNNQNLYTLPLAVMALDSGVFRQWNVLMAGSLIAIVPIIIVFYTMQRYYIQGLTSGAVKS